MEFIENDWRLGAECQSESQEEDYRQGRVAGGLWAGEIPICNPIRLGQIATVVVSAVRPPHFDNLGYEVLSK